MKKPTKYSFEEEIYAIEEDEELFYTKYQLELELPDLGNNIRVAKYVLKEVLVSKIETKVTLTKEE
jgi:hypothetical protein